MRVKSGLHDLHYAPVMPVHFRKIKATIRSYNNVAIVMKLMLNADGYYFNGLCQGFPTYGPWAACGLRGNFLRSAKSNIMLPYIC